MITETHPTTKAAVAKALAQLGVEVPPSRVKKTPLADLTRMLDEANAKPKKARARKASNVVPIDAAKRPRKSAGVHLPAKDASQLRACRAGSKQAILIDIARAQRDPGRTRCRPEAVEREQRQERALLGRAQA